MNALPGLAGGGNAQAASGPLAGFEALLAALFGDTDIAGVVTGGGGASPTADETVDPTGLETDAAPAAAPAPGTGAETLLNSLLLAQTAPAHADAAGTEPAAEATPPAWGQDKAKGAPAAPAVANADPNAGLAAKAAGETDAPAADPVAPETAPATQHASAAPQAPQASRPVAVPAQQPPAAAPAATVDAAAEVPPPSADPEIDPLPAAAVAREALAAPSAREEITRAADAAPPAPPSRKEKKGHAAERGKDGEDAKAEGVSARSAASAATPAAANAGAKGQAGAKAPDVEAPTPEARRMDPPEAIEPAHAAETKSATQAASAAKPDSPAVRGAPETVANLAAQIVKKLDGRATRFDVELDPIGLGKVDVRIEIGAHGRMTAAMSFETSQAAAELKSRSGELQRALEQAGFDLSGGLSFDVAGDRGQARQEWSEGQGGGFRGRAFQQALETAGEADLAAASGELRLRRGVTGGVDVRI